MISDVYYAGHTSNAYRASDQPRCARRALAFPVNANRMYRIRTTIATANEFRKSAVIMIGRLQTLFYLASFRLENIFLTLENSRSLKYLRTRR